MRFDIHTIEEMFSQSRLPLPDFIVHVPETVVKHYARVNHWLKRIRAQGFAFGSKNQPRILVFPRYFPTSTPYHELWHNFVLSLVDICPRGYGKFLRWLNQEYFAGEYSSLRKPRRVFGRRVSYQKISGSAKDAVISELVENYNEKSSGDKYQADVDMLWEMTRQVINEDPCRVEVFQRV